MTATTTATTTTTGHDVLPEFLENHPISNLQSPISEIRPGDSASLERTVTQDDIRLFAAVTGDVNPAHVDALYASGSFFHEIIAHGMLGGAWISSVLGTQFPGPGTIYRGQIVGALVDGPLAFDNAVSMASVKTKGIVSPVAGDADILVVPHLDAGNMVAKQLEYLGDAQAAGLVVGAQVPIVLTSRADSAHSRLASCAIALLLARHQKNKPI